MNVNMVRWGDFSFETFSSDRLSKFCWKASSLVAHRWFGAGQLLLTPEMWYQSFWPSVRIFQCMEEGSLGDEQVSYKMQGKMPKVHVWNICRTKTKNSTDSREVSKGRWRNSLGKNNERKSALLIDDQLPIFNLHSQIFAQQRQKNGWNRVWTKSKSK